MHTKLDTPLYKWMLTITFLALTTFVGQAMEQDSTWLKRYSAYIQRKAKTIHTDSLHTDESQQQFLQRLIHSTDSTYADSSFVYGTQEDTIKYLLHNRQYLGALLEMVHVQSKASPFYPYLTRYNHIVTHLPEQYASEKRHSLVVSSSLYLGMEDYDQVMHYSEEVIQSILKGTTSDNTYQDLNIDELSLFYLMAYYQLQCYDLITPNILERNWAFMTSSIGKDACNHLRTFDDYFFLIDMFYAMCTKQYDQAIAICDTNIQEHADDQHAKIICARVQNVAIERLPTHSQYIKVLKRNYKLVNQYNMDYTKGNHMDFSILHKVNKLEKNISADLLLQEKFKVWRSWGLLSFGFAVFILLIWGLYSILVASKKTKSLMNDVQNEISTTEHKIDDAEKARKMQSLYLNNMNHEIRSPLNAVVGFSQLLLDDDELDEDSKQMFSKYIENSSDLLLQIVNDVLDTAQLTSGNYTLEKTDCLVITVCEQAIQSTQYRVQEGVKIVTDFQVDAHTLAHTDKNRLLQILLNFLSNACKHTPSGTITLSCHWLDTDKRQLRFAVTDTGSGVPEDKIDSLFKRFAKLNDNIEGIGLGLNICATLADLLHGRVGYDRAYKDGARFYFELPVKS